MYICFDYLYISEGFTFTGSLVKAHLNYTNSENTSVTQFWRLNGGK